MPRLYEICRKKPNGGNFANSPSPTHCRPIATLSLFSLFYCRAIMFPTPISYVHLYCSVFALLTPAVFLALIPQCCDFFVFLLSDCMHVPVPLYRDHDLLSHASLHCVCPDQFDNSFFAWIKPIQQSVSLSRNYSELSLDPALSLPTSFFDVCHALSGF